MADDIATAGTGNGQPELVDVVINNQTITTTKAHGDILKSMWTGIQTGANQKFEDAKKEREEAKRTADFMAEDAAWFNAHDPSLYGQYELKSQGGRGFIGDESQVNPAMSGDNYNPDAEAKHTAEIAALNAKVDELSGIVKTGQQANSDSALEGAVIAREELAKDAGINLGSVADKMVTKQMENFYYTNNRHPRKHEISPMVDSVKELMGMGKSVTPPPAAITPATTPATPPASGNSPPPAAPKELDLSGPDGFQNLKNDINGFIEQRAAQ